MTDREALIAGLAAEPANRTAQFVFADWLDEHGEEALAKKVREYDGLVCRACAAGAIALTVDAKTGEERCPECNSERWIHRCGHHTCDHAGVPCTFSPIWTGEEWESFRANVFYCRDHCHLYGYCPRCFCEGATSVTVYCQDCLDVIAREEAEHDDYYQDDDNEFFDDIPF